MKKTCPKKQSSGTKSPVVTAYEKIESGVVSGYKKTETCIVSGFQKVCDKCIEVLFSREGESLEDTKKRLSNKE